MPDIIRLLPEGVANQIAAGEVIQRPASVLKELMENSIDAGSTDIQVVIKDAGRTLVQVTDNGCGMSTTDARMCFERHATSKIRLAADLFAIRTMGFRGEAMASIAAVAQVEIKTKRTEDEVGTCILVEGSDVKDQSACGCANGTLIAVKNLFYNVPARRKFLKSDPVEFRNIMEEFQRIAIAHPSLSLSIYHNNRIIQQLPVSNLKTRITNILGSASGERLVPVDEKTNLVTVSGFIGKPQYARKTRGEQYFFANQRFIRHPYLHHAVQEAYTELIPEDAHPSYFILLDVDPENIDVNIHPTKIEVNFLHQKIIYEIVKASVKKALGMHNLTPAIDFDQEQALPVGTSTPSGFVSPPAIHINPDYSPFDRASSSDKYTGQSFKQNTRNWEKLYQTTGEETTARQTMLQIHDRYIVSSLKSGLLIIDQQAAHDRILFERYLEILSHQKAASQQLLYPQTIHCSAQDFDLISELQEELQQIGFEISEFGKSMYVVTGVPVGLENQDIGELIDSVLENYKQNKADLTRDKKINFARSMSRQQTIRAGQKLAEQEMNKIIDELFACKAPEIAPDGKKTFIIIPFEELDKRLK